MIRVRLTSKLALCMNGIDVSALKVGDVLELPEDRAQMMIELGWAAAVPPPLTEVRRTPHNLGRGTI
jgi:hypothetical protein